MDVTRPVDIVQAIAATVAAGATIAAVAQLIYVRNQLRVQQLQFMAQMLSGKEFAESYSKMQTETRRVIKVLPLNSQIDAKQASELADDQDANKALQETLSQLDLLCAVALERGFHDSAIIEHFSFRVVATFTRYFPYVKEIRKRHRIYAYSRLEYTTHIWAEKLARMPEVGPNHPVLVLFREIPAPIINKNEIDPAQRFLPNPLNWPDMPKGDSTVQLVKRKPTKRPL